MRTIAPFIAAAACLALLLGKPAAAQSKPRLQDLSGFMSKGVFTELDRELMKQRLSQAETETLHFDGKETNIQAILKFMAKAEKLRSKIDEPLEVRGEIPLTLPPNTTGEEAYTTCFYAFNLNGLVIAGRGGELILIRPETQAQGATAGTNLEPRADPADPALPPGIPESPPDPRPVRGQAWNKGRSRHSRAQVQRRTRLGQGGLARKTRALHRRGSARSDGRAHPGRPDRSR